MNKHPIKDRRSESVQMYCIHKTSFSPPTHYQPITRAQAALHSWDWFSIKTRHSLPAGAWPGPGCVSTQQKCSQRLCVTQIK